MDKIDNHIFSVTEGCCSLIGPTVLTGVTGPTGATGEAGKVRKHLNPEFKMEISDTSNSQAYNFPKEELKRGRIKKFKEDINPKKFFKGDYR